MNRTPQVKCSRCRVSVPEHLIDQPYRCVDRACPLRNWKKSASGSEPRSESERRPQP